MTTTTNLGIDLIETNQTQKEVTANAATTALEAALTDAVEIEVEDGSNAVADADFRDGVALVLTDGGVTAAFDVVLPALKGIKAVINTTGEDATIACEDAASGAEEATVSAGATAIVYCDGTQVWQLTADLSSTVDAFTDLADAPSSYGTGDDGRPVVVNESGDGVEFGDWPVQCIPVAVSDETTDLTTGAGKVTFRMPFAFELTEVRASVTTAPTDDDIEVDINVTGTGSILSTVITIEATEKSSKDATTQPVISTASLADDAEVTIDIGQVGSTVAGAGLKVYLIGRPA